MRRIPLLATALVLTACGTDVSGPSASLFSCVLGEGRATAVGEVVTVSGAAHQSLCLTAGDTTTVFAYVPFYALASTSQGDQSQVRLAVDVLGAGVMDASVTVDPVAGLPGLVAAQDRWLDHDATPGPRPGGDLHRQIREREIAELEPLIRRSPAPPPSAPTAGMPAASVPEVGEYVQFNVALSCTLEQMRTGQVRWVSERAIVVVDTRDPTGLTNADFQHFALSFDTLVYPVSTHHFGAPSDIDGNGRIYIFLTGAVNQRNAPGENTFTAAMFWSGDLFPAESTSRLEACPAANQAEMFYMAIPDPNGLLGPVVTVRWIQDRALHVMAHEYQHLVNAGRRLHVNQAITFERTWLNEGLSHVAEELMFFATSGLERRTNIDATAIENAPNGVAAASHYMASNLDNLNRFLRQSRASSLMGPDDLATRGATWSFLRYALDRSGRGDDVVLRSLLNSSTAGTDNLDQALAASSLEWMHDWAVSLYADDHVPGLDPRYTQPSWNFRDLFSGQAGGYPLPLVPLRPGETHHVSIQPGGTGHMIFAVGTEGRAAIHVEVNDGTPPRTVRGSFLRIQ
jgi:hypothetical protein